MCYQYGKRCSNICRIFVCESRRHKYFIACFFTMKKRWKWVLLDNTKLFFNTKLVMEIVRTLQLKKKYPQWPKKWTYLISTWKHINTARLKYTSPQNIQLSFQGDIWSRVQVYQLMDVLLSHWTCLVYWKSMRIDRSLATSTFLCPDVTVPIALHSHHLSF